MSLIQQRLATDCAICTIAMALERDYDEVMAAALKCEAFSSDTGTWKEYAIIETFGFEQMVDFRILHRGPLAPEYFRHFSWGDPGGTEPESREGLPFGLLERVGAVRSLPEKDLSVLGRADAGRDHPDGRDRQASEGAAMTVRLGRLLTWQEHQALNEECRAKGWYMYDRRAFLPGMGWLNEWYLELDQDDRDFLSAHYKRDWKGKRPPIELVCPNGSVWCIDRRSSNGDGWQVRGEWPNLIISPSIVADDYHGFLGSHGQPPGVFSPHLEDRTRTWPIPNIPPNYGQR